MWKMERERKKGFESEGEGRGGFPLFALAIFLIQLKGTHNEQWYEAG
jgi:hypothetical protein